LNREADSHNFEAATGVERRSTIEGEAAMILLDVSVRKKFLLFLGNNFESKFRRFGWGDLLPVCHPLVQPRFGGTVCIPLSAFDI
jgi:hypothetical protein